MIDFPESAAFGRKVSRVPVTRAFALASAYSIKIAHSAARGCAELGKALMTAKFQELVAKLKEIFQLDKQELDFGIYRIMHMRAKEIGEFLEKRLAEKVRTALAGNSAASAPTRAATCPYCRVFGIIAAV